MVEHPTEGTSPAVASPTRQLTDQLTHAHAALAALGNDYADHCAELENLRQRLSAGRFHLAVLGQFKRGKSTLLNALLGEELLPTDILPVTAIPTFISYAAKPSLCVSFADQTDDLFVTSEKQIAAVLHEYVTEVGNPHNQRQVSLVEIKHPAELLQQGVVLIDTPGVGSTLKHNTEVAHQILPRCDAALFLVSPDPPITEMELDYLGRVKQHLPRIFFLLNKVDFLTDKERIASLQFLGDQLTPFCEGSPTIMSVSARDGLSARVSNDSEKWQQSGMQKVEQNLIDFFVREKQQTLLQAISRRSSDLIEGAILQLQLSLRALKMPADQLQESLRQFHSSLPAIEREQEAANDVLAGDLKRAIHQLGHEIEQLRHQTQSQLLTQIEGYLDSVEDPEEMERAVRKLVAEETAKFFAPAMQNTAEKIRQEATQLLSLNQQRSNQLIDQVRQTAADIFSIPYHAPAAGNVYATFTFPDWSDELFISDLDPLGQRLSRKLLTKKYRRLRTVNRLREGCRQLLNRNIEQIHWTLRRSLDESFRQFGAELAEQLEKTIVATRQAIEIAVEKKEIHSQETAALEQNLEQAAVRLEELKTQLRE